MIVEARADPVHSKALPDLIGKLLTERQEMLVLFNRLAEYKTFTRSAPAQAVLQRFCQVLMDYIALGHFEVYQCIEEGTGNTERCRKIKEMARDLYPRIAATTQTAVDFNDRYDSGNRVDVVKGLSGDLSRLGEQLATRVELEDRLIAAIRSS